MKRNFFHFGLYALMLISWFASYLTYGQQRFAIDQINRLVNITDLNISPDGNMALFVVAHRNLEKNSFDRELIVLNLQTNQQQVVGKDLKDINAPTWMNNDDIALIAATGNGRQVQLLNFKTGIVKVITQSSTGIARYAWSPDEKWLAYLAKEDKPIVSNKFNDSFEVGDNDMYASVAPLNTHLWIMDMEGKAQQITKEGTTSTGLTTTTLSWQQDSKLLAFTIYPTAHSGSSDFGKNFIYDIAAQTMKPATNNKDNESTPLFTPSNQQLWFTYPRDGIAANISDWHQVDLKSGTFTNITSALDRQINQVTWLQDGRYC